ncbi:PD-(D/E)XK nuclease family protein [Blattabacterium cuenoti]|uniref:PD-(D/E)XK nuclease family protein n=1 Tax=Blattabacterium cuenoti TaxID=1653831 RepID=UPI00163CEF4F|nr:PD-(D/E)XK nuclease family protein [Blattabacterium cuenoti]
MKKILEKIFFLKKKILVSKDDTTIRIIREKYNWNKNILNNINFLTIKKLIDTISGLKRINKCETLLSFFSILEKKDFLEEELNLNNFIQNIFKILNDFQDIDYNLINSKHFFEYLISEERILKWNFNLSNNKKFFLWKKIHLYYDKFRFFLLQQRIAYNGLLLRECLFKINSNNYKKIIFIIPKNCYLNQWEKFFLEKIISNKKGIIYELFSNRILVNYETSIFNKRKINNFNKLKIINVTREIEQIIFIKNLIKKKIQKKNNTKINKIALILGDENLLISIVNSFIRNLNINISFNINYPLKIIPIHYTFVSIFKLLLNKSLKKSFQKNDIINFLTNGYIKKFFLKKKKLSNFIEKINNTKSNSISNRIINNFLLNNNVEIIFQIQLDNTKKIIKSLISFIRKLKFFLIKNLKDNLLEFLFIHKIEFYIQKIKILIRKKKYPFSMGIINVYHLYNQFINTENIQYTTKKFYKNSKKLLLITDFPYFNNEKFDLSIITSCNSGMIPKKNNIDNFTLISNDIRNRFNINSTNYEYNFRIFLNIYKFSKKTYILYKDNPDDINSGEKSSFINHIMINNPKINIAKKKFSLYPYKKKTRKAIVIKKNHLLIEKLNEISKKGLSPSSINLYNYNPILFYYKKILGINVLESNSYKIQLGKIIHQILENLYENNIKNFLTVHRINEMKKIIKPTISKFLNINDTILSFFLTKNYIKNFLLWDEKLVKQGEKIFIKKIEYKISTLLSINNSKKVVLQGIIDRIDEHDGITKIIDYKIGISKFRKINISINNIKNIFENPYYKNVMQLLFYIYLWYQSNIENQKYPVKIGIISINKKNKSNFIEEIPIIFFNKKTYITYQKYIKFFLPFLIKRISEILNPKNPIIEKI